MHTNIFRLQRSSEYTERSKMYDERVGNVYERFQGYRYIEIALTLAMRWHKGLGVTVALHS